MATPATNPAPAPLDWAAATKHLEAIKTKVMSYAGQSGMNPFMWWDKHGAKFEQSLEAGHKTPELHSMIMKFAFAEPKAPALGVNVRRPTSKVTGEGADGL